MLSFRDQIIQLIEQASLLPSESIPQYATKILRFAEILTLHERERLRALVAFYCNDPQREVAFVTMVVVDQADRRRGLARTLLSAALGMMRQRSFRTCRLKVNRDNAKAIDLYRELGFGLLSQDETQVAMELVF